MIEIDIHSLESFWCLLLNRRGIILSQKLLKLLSVFVCIESVRESYIK